MFFFTTPRPPRSTRTDTLFPYTTLLPSDPLPPDVAPLTSRDVWRIRPGSGYRPCRRRACRSEPSLRAWLEPRTWKSCRPFLVELDELGIGHLSVVHGHRAVHLHLAVVHRHLLRGVRRRFGGLRVVTGGQCQIGRASGRERVGQYG